LIIERRILTIHFIIKNYRLAIIGSVVLHLFVIFILIKTTHAPIATLPLKTENRVIKSYLYAKPTKEKKERVAPKVVNKIKTQKDEIKKEIVVKVELKKETLETVSKKVNNPDTIMKSTSQPDNEQREPIVPSSSDMAKLMNKANKKDKQQSLNLESLSQLKDKINQQIIDQEMYNYSRPKTGSVMHGEPTYVPHSTDENTPEKTISATASQVGNGFSITKNDNGGCSLTEDLSAIGLQGKTTSGFKCGLSKDEKAFNDHMKKVLKKLGK
jgi:hypothetical protein